MCHMHLSPRMQWQDRCIGGQVTFGRPMIMQRSPTIEKYCARVLRVTEIVSDTLQTVSLVLRAPCFQRIYPTPTDTNSWPGGVGGAGPSPAG